MATFGITPASGFNPPASEEFPNFIQFQDDGTDLGSNDADTVNFRRGMSATRGVGANANVVTVDAAVFTWREVTEDETLVGADLTNGIAANGAGSALTITVPGDTELGLLEGDGDVSVLIRQSGQAAVYVVGQSGVTINVRSALSAITAGQHAVISLIHTGANEWVICGDLSASA